ncbi:beta strand repeat-containing protein [Candidatus Sulfurimonas baltica]|uniref:Cadherin domain-containing protein n=1 Tax=Candidatus Sulfurimonas baltica TaxID=2740404 RepID=A0A7S7LTF6_9BACT|nr:VCBS domain-containing protein [Candidatus Sulfurimonas baltica]QOY51007.1 hypothetical protein HUE88_07590 [Candidatus Sulfurimonas baltica]
MRTMVLFTNLKEKSKNACKLFFQVSALLLFFNTDAYAVAPTAVAPAAGDGSSGTPYEIATLDNLYWISQTQGVWSKTGCSGGPCNFKQTADINASTTNEIVGGEGWSSIGYANNTGLTTWFYGNYDGQGHTISNLFADNNTTLYEVALFGRIRESTIQNIVLKDFSITRGEGTYDTVKSSIAIAIGSAYSSTVSDINISGGTLTFNDLTSGKGHVAPLIAYSNGTSVSNCHSSANVEVSGLNAAGASVGGLLGYVEDSYDPYTFSITNSSATGNVTHNTPSNAQVTNIGGFTGEFSIAWNTAVVSQNFSSGTITTGNANDDSYVGGFVGRVDGTVELKDNYTIGTIVLSDTGTIAAGFVGYIYSTAIFRRNYAATTIASNSDGGFGGIIYNLTADPVFDNNFWDTDTTNNATGVGGEASDSNVTGKTTAEMKTPSTFTGAGWDFEVEIANGTANIWDMDNINGTINNGYPFLAWENGTSVSYKVIPTAEAPSGTGTSGDPYQIATLNNLVWVSENSSSWDGKYFTQTTDINASNLQNITGGLTPIGNLANSFIGHYDGGGHTISNLYINKSVQYIGLFGHIGYLNNDASVKHLNIQDANITGNMPNQYSNGLGILAGHVNDNQKTIVFEDVNVTGGSLTLASVDTAYSKVGALIGSASNTISVDNCNVSATIVSQDTTLTNKIGGLIGELNSDNTVVTNITRSSSAGSITTTDTAKQTVGGFIGEILSKNRIKESFTTTTINSNGYAVGGFIGAFSYSNTYISDSYSKNGITTTAVRSGGFYGYIVASTVAQNFENTYAASTVAGTLGGGFGGYVSSSTAPTFADSYWDTDLSGTTNGYYNTNVVNLVGKTTAEMKVEPTFTGFDFSTVWDTNSSINDTYPYLLWLPNTAPTYTINLSAISINEDNGTISYEINATDTDSDDLNITVDSNDTSIMMVSPSWTGNQTAAQYANSLDFNLTTVNHAYGSVQITVSVNDGTVTTSNTYDINVSAVNDIPVFSGTFAGTATEDIGTQSSGTISIDDNDTGENIFQDVNATGTYGTFVLDTNGSWTYDINSSLSSVQELAGGDIGVDNFIVTSDDGNVSQIFSISISGVNDAPTFVTDLISFSVNEDNGTISYELNATDIEGEDLNITVDSNNTDILTVSPSWSGLLNQGAYDGVALDFNLTTAQDANGLVRITVMVNDGDKNSTTFYDVNVMAVNDMPTFSTNLIAITINEDNGTISYELNATDVDADDLNITVDSNDTSIITVSPSWSGDQTAAQYASLLDFNLSTVQHANGIVQITITANDGIVSSSTTYDINVSAVNDIPVFSGTFAGTATEDIGTQSSGTISIDDNDTGENIFQDVNATGTYGTFVLDTNGSWTYDINSSLSSVQELAGGDIGVDNFIVTSDDGNVSQIFSISISGVNDAPTFVTDLISFSVNEDNGTISYELNATDIEGEDLNITVDSNNTDILTVSPSWSGLLNQGAYDGVALDFNLTTAQDANGLVRITVMVNDGDKNSTTFYDVNVMAVNDAPVWLAMSNIAVYQDFSETNITLGVSDVDNSNLTYSAVVDDPSLIKDVTFSSNIMTIISQDTPVAGDTNITVYASDNDFNISREFNFFILPIDDGQDVMENNITVTKDENSTTITLGVAPGLSMKTIDDVNGTVAHEVTISGVSVSAVSELNTSVVEFMQSGVRTTYSDVNVSLEVNATLTGKATHEMTNTLSGAITRAISEFIGAVTRVYRDINNEVEILTSVAVNANSTVSVTAKADGTATHKVVFSGKESIVDSNVTGASTIIKTTGDVETTAGQVDDGNGYDIKAVAITKPDGKTTTKFIKVSQSDANDVSTSGNTLHINSAFTLGNSVNILEVGGVLYIQVTTPLAENLVVE